MSKSIFRLMLASFVALTCNQAFAKGRLNQILEMAEKNCRPALESALEAMPGLEAVQEPFQIQSERLVLRTMDIQNEALMNRAIEVYTNPKVMEMSGDYLDAGTVRRIQRAGRPSPAYLHGSGMVNLYISKLNSVTGEEEVIGFAQLAKTMVDGASEKGLVKNQDKWFEISYHLDPAYWGNRPADDRPVVRGYGSEIAKALINHAMTKEDAEGVYAQTIIQNDRSGGVLKKAGMVEILRKEAEGGLHYAITREQFAKTATPEKIDFEAIFLAGAALQEKLYDTKKIDYLLNPIYCVNPASKALELIYTVDFRHRDDSYVITNGNPTKRNTSELSIEVVSTEMDGSYEVSHIKADGKTLACVTSTSVLETPF